MKTTQQYNDDPIPYEGDIVSEVLIANKNINTQLTFAKNDLFNPPVPCDDYSHVLSVGGGWNASTCTMSQDLSNGDKVSITLVIERNIVDRLEIEKIVKGEKETSTMSL